MIRGYKREVYILKDTGSKLFEEAVFVMKRNLPPISEYTIKQEAEKIIADKTALYAKKAVKNKK